MCRKKRQFSRDSTCNPPPCCLVSRKVEGSSAWVGFCKFCRLLSGLSCLWNAHSKVEKTGRETERSTGRDRDENKEKEESETGFTCQLSIQRVVTLSGFFFLINHSPSWENLGRNICQAAANTIDPKMGNTFRDQSADCRDPRRLYVYPAIMRGKNLG